MKKFFAVLCLLSLFALCAFGCDRETETDGYYRLFASYVAPTSAAKADLFGYSFHEFLERDFVAVSATEDEKTLYGVVNAATGELLFTPEYAEVKMVGDFFLLSPGSDSAGYRVAASDGTILSESATLPEVADIGQGLVSVATSTSSVVYNAKGEDVLSSSQMTAEYVYTACDNFIIAKNTVKGDCQVFNLRTGEVKLSLYPKASELISLYYAGGNDFIAIYDLETSEDGNYDAVLSSGGEDRIYLKQTVYLLTVGVKTPHILPIDGYIASLTNQYSFGKTQEMRENYPLKDGYFTMGLYNLTNKEADGSIRYAVTDGSLNVQAELPDGIRPDTNTRDGYFISGMQAATVRLCDDKLNTLLTLSDGPYHSATYSDGVIVLSKIIDGVSSYGAVDTKGNSVIPFKYSYLSVFIGEKAIGVRDRKSYLVEKDGTETYLSDDPLPYWWDGYYEYTENGLIGLRSYNGSVLTPAAYSGVENVTRYGDVVYVALRIGTAVDVYRLA